MIDLSGGQIVSIVLAIITFFIIWVSKFITDDEVGSTDSAAKQEPDADSCKPGEKITLGKEPEPPKPPTRWHMAPKATMVIELDLDRIPPSMALGSLLQMQDIVKAFYQEQAQKAAQLKNRIVRPSMVDKTEAILNKRPS